MAEIVDLLLSFAVTTTLIAVLLTKDERRLTPERLARAWPPSTKRIAIVFGGIFCIPIHFTRTRRSVLGFLIGLGWMVAVAVVTGVVSTAVGWALGISD